MTTLVDADTGRVVGVVDGRDSAGVGAWLAARSPSWRAAVEVVAIDPSAAFRRALRQQLPAAAVSVDAFHLVRLANDMVTAVRQRVIRERKGRRGRLVDPAWVNRRLLLRAGNTLSPGALARLKATLRADDPTDEIGAAWGIKEQLRRLLASGSLAEAHEQKMLLGTYVLAADLPEANRLWNTIDAWWEAIEVLLVTGVTNARTEAANTSIKQIKRTGRGYRNPRPLPRSYSPGQCRPTRGMNTRLSARHHAEVRRAPLLGAAKMLGARAPHPCPTTGTPPVGICAWTPTTLMLNGHD